MKKAFIQLLMGILKYKKRLIYGVLALFISQICFFNLGGIGWGGQAFAQTNYTPTQNESFQNEVSKWSSSVSFLQKLVYILIYPILILAGKLVDNSFVYGEVFGFDVILWDLWVIMRNLANFCLGFIFIYKIFDILIHGKEGDKIKTLLKGSLIAGIGIQASWFVMAALIDLSSIVTYGIGGLPISILGSDIGSEKADSKDVETNPYILKTIVYFDASDADSFHTYLTNVKIGEEEQKSSIYISECKTFFYEYPDSGSGGKITEELIYGPQMIYYVDEKNEIHKTENNKCHYYGQVYYFADSKITLSCGDLQSCKDSQHDYEADQESDITKKKSFGISEIKGLVDGGTLLQVGDAHSTGGILALSKIQAGVYSEKCLGLDKNNECIGDSTSRLNDLIDSSNSYVGVFTSLYSSLMNAGRGGLQTDGSSTYATFLGVVLSFLHMVAIGLPLIVMCLVFLMRIGIIWMAIALSPMIALFAGFRVAGDDMSETITKNVKFLDYFTIKNLIPIIFSPAVICFAVSMSTVLVRTIEKLGFNDVITNDNEILGGLIRINIAGLGLKLGNFIVAVMGIAITRFLVWAALGMSKLGSDKNGIVQKLKGLAEGALQAAPIIPIPGKDGKGTVISYAGLREAVNKKTNDIKESLTGGDTTAIEEMFDKEGAQSAAADRMTASYNGGLEAMDISKIPASWTTAMPIVVTGEDKKQHDLYFENLDPSSKRSAIELINKMEPNKRNAFGNSQSVISFKDNGETVTYKYEVVSERKEKDENGVEQVVKEYRYNQQKG